MNLSYLRYLLVFTCMIGTLAYGATDVMKNHPHQSIVQTFNWFNQISAKARTPYTMDDVAHFFTKDAKMITNGKLVCEGIQQHYDHFKELNDHTTALHVEVNEIDMQQSGKRVYLHYRIQGIDKNNQPFTYYVMGYMVLENGKIALFNEVVFKEMAYS